MTQILLFRDPCPLVERLGLDFFRQLPERPGVYLMRGAADALLYVGKAKNLRKRLCSYRVANPDRMPRRHLRLLRAVERIEIQECADESAALQREAELLRAHKPKFNRAGTWPDAEIPGLENDGHRLALDSHFVARSRLAVAWSAGRGRVSFARGDGAASMGGPLSGTRHFQNARRLVRGNLAETVTLQFPNESADFSRELSGRLDNLPGGRTDEFGTWILAKASTTLLRFEQAVLAADIEYLTETFELAPRAAVTQKTEPARE